MTGTTGRGAVLVDVRAEVFRFVGHFLPLSQRDTLYLSPEDARIVLDREWPFEAIMRIDIRLRPGEMRHERR